MITKKVDNCRNCPFLCTEYDDYATGDSIIEMCNLSLFNNDKTEYIIDTHDNISKVVDEGLPEWCPLINSDYLIKL